MHIDVLTIFPEYFQSVLSVGILGRAITRKLIEIDVVNIRDFAEDKYRRVDDSPFGGGPGMVMMAPPLHRAIESCRMTRPAEEKRRVIYLGPGGERFDQRKAENLSELEHLILLCGRYEGVDQRVIDYYVDDVISIGDYVISGGEAAALVVIEATGRLIPGFVGNRESLEDESFSGTGEKEYPHYTRPKVYDGHAVPEVLVSGNHEAVRKWRESKKSI